MNTVHIIKEVRGDMTYEFSKIKFEKIVALDLNHGLVLEDQDEDFINAYESVDSDRILRLCWDNEGVYVLPELISAINENKCGGIALEAYVVGYGRTKWEAIQGLRNLGDESDLDVSDW